MEMIYSPRHELVNIDFSLEGLPEYLVEYKIREYLRELGYFIYPGEDICRPTVFLDEGSLFRDKEFNLPIPNQEIELLRLLSKT